MLRALRYSMNGMPSSGGITGWFGRNLSASGFGVLSVWMKMLRAPRGNEGMAARGEGEGEGEGEVDRVGRVRAMRPSDRALLLVCVFRPVS